MIYKNTKNFNQSVFAPKKAIPLFKKNFSWKQLKGMGKFVHRSKDGDEIIHFVPHGVKPGYFRHYKWNITQWERV